MNGEVVLRYGNVPIYGDEREFINATNMWYATGSKEDLEPWLWVKQPRVVNYAMAVAHKYGLSASGMSEVDGYTVMLHWELALDYARDLDHHFHHEANRAIRRWIAGHAETSQIPQEHANDPIIAIRLQQLEMGKRLESLEAQHASLSQTVAKGPSHWAVSAWLSAKGIKATDEVIRREGMNLRRICQEHGILVPEEKVCMGTSWPARKWPIEAIRIWWPDFKRRYALDG